MIEQLRDLGYRVEWSQGATPDELREKHRENGWAWEGDTEVRHHIHVTHRLSPDRRSSTPLDGPEPLQTTDPEAPGYIPEHHILADDSEQPAIWFVEGPVTGGGVGEPTGYAYKDGTPIGPLVQTYVREDDEEAWKSLVDGRDEFVAELEKCAGETRREAEDRRAREAEERAAEES